MSVTVPVYVSDPDTGAALAGGDLFLVHSYPFVSEDKTFHRAFDVAVQDWRTGESIRVAFGRMTGGEVSLIRLRLSGELFRHRDLLARRCAQAVASLASGLCGPEVRPPSTSWVDGEGQRHAVEADVVVTGELLTARVDLGASLTSAQTVRRVVDNAHVDVGRLDLAWTSYDREGRSWTLGCEFTADVLGRSRPGWYVITDDGAERLRDDVEDVEQAVGVLTAFNRRMVFLTEVVDGVLEEWVRTTCAGTTGTRS